jgi:OmpR-family two-component system manganese-sensing sensor histidine kinase
MFQSTRRWLAIWYTTITAVLLMLFGSGMYWYVHSTLVERVDDTLNHVLEVVRRSLVIEPVNFHSEGGPLYLNVEASFRNNLDAVEDDHIDLEWFSTSGKLLWSTFSTSPTIPLHPEQPSKTVQLSSEHALRQITERIQVGQQILGFLRVSHPWFEVTKPSRELLVELVLGITGMIASVAGIGWLLSGLAISPVRESYQRLKQFTADASHELRNPVASIQTTVQVALADPHPDPALQRQHLEVVERLTRRLGRLVDDLLFLARQDSGMVQPYYTKVLLPKLLGDVVEEQQAAAASKEITLSLSLQSLGAEQLSLHVDRDQIARLLTNLISNAVQYTPSKGTVTITLQSTRRPNGLPQLQIVIQDNGIGIAPEALPNIFDRFYRVDPARSRDNARRAGATTTGSGLGLAISQAIVENHHGQIRIDSTLGQGTTVTVTLPQQNPIDLRDTALQPTPVP